MILVRSILRAQFGRGGELAAHLAETSRTLMAELGARQPWRVLTDLSGAYDTVVLEVEADSLAQWEQVRPRLFQSRAFHESVGRLQALVVSGRAEYFTIEAAG